MEEFCCGIRDCVNIERCILLYIVPSLVNFRKSIVGVSVADPGCLSRIPDPDFYPFRIPDLGSRIQKQQQKRGVKKN
jgi:hypothetical protein